MMKLTTDNKSKIVLMAIYKKKKPFMTDFNIKGNWEEAFRGFSRLFSFPPNLNPSEVDLEILVDAIQTGADRIDQAYAGCYISAILNAYQTNGKRYALSFDKITLDYFGAFSEYLYITVNCVKGNYFAQQAGSRKGGAVIICDRVEGANCGFRAGSYLGRAILVANEIVGDYFANQAGSNGCAIIYGKTFSSDYCGYEIGRKEYNDMEEGSAILLGDTVLGNNLGYAAGENDGKAIVYGIEVKGGNLGVCSGRESYRADKPKIKGRVYLIGEDVKGSKFGQDAYAKKIWKQRYKYPPSTYLKMNSIQLKNLLESKERYFKELQRFHERYPEIKKIKSLLEDPLTNEEEIWELYEKAMNTLARDLTRSVIRPTGRVYGTSYSDEYGNYY